MKQVTAGAIEHVVETTDRPYDSVKASLEEQMSTLADIGELVTKLLAARMSWGEAEQMLNQRLGDRFGIFNKVEQGRLLAAAGKPGRTTQYTVGNPLLAIQMIEHEPEIALYAPLKLAVYSTHSGHTCISYDSFTSVVASYRHPEIIRVAAIVQQKLEAMVASALG